MGEKGKKRKRKRALGFFIKQARVQHLIRAKLSEIWSSWGRSIENNAQSTNKAEQGIFRRRASNRDPERERIILSPKSTVDTRAADQPGHDRKI